MGVCVSWYGGTIWFILWFSFLPRLVKEVRLGLDWNGRLAAGWIACCMAYYSFFFYVFFNLFTLSHWRVS